MGTQSPEKHSHNLRIIASIAIMITGFYAILEAISLLKPLIEAFSIKNNQLVDKRYLILSAGVPMFLLLFTGTYLIFYREKIAKKIIKTPHKDLFSSDLQELQAIAFSIIGIFLIVDTLPGLIQIGYNLSALKRAGSEDVMRDITIGTKGYAISLIIKAFLGMILFIGGKGLASIWRFLQKTRPLYKYKQSQ